MSFSYTPTAVNNVTRVRFHTGDTVEAEAWLSDEEINMLIAEEGSWQKAVIAAIRHVIARLSQPDFRADWLQVSSAQAREGFEALLKQKQAELKIAAVQAKAQAVYRSDSLQTEAPEGW